MASMWSIEGKNSTIHTAPYIGLALSLLGQSFVAEHPRSGAFLTASNAVDIAQQGVLSEKERQERQAAQEKAKKNRIINTMKGSVEGGVTGFATGGPVGSIAGSIGGAVSGLTADPAKASTEVDAGTLGALLGMLSGGTSASKVFGSGMNPSNQAMSIPSSNSGSAAANLFDPTNQWGAS